MNKEQEFYGLMNTHADHVNTKASTSGQKTISELTDTVDGISGGGKDHTFDIPTISGTYTYTGSSQTPTVVGYYSNFMTASGNTSATNAGSYSITYALKDTTNCQWRDGTTENKTVAWSIAKAALPTPTLSKNSVTVGPGATGTFSVTRSGDGVISATSNKPSKASANVSGTTVSVTALDTSVADTATITVAIAEGTNYLAYSGSPLTVTANIITTAYPAWENASWADLKSAANDGVFGDIYGNDVGKTKDITLTDDSVYAFRLVDASGNIYNKAGTSQKASAVFEMVRVYKTGTTFASSTSAGYAASNIRTTALPGFLALLPTEITNIIEEVSVSRRQYYNSSWSTITTDMKLFIPALKELGTTMSNADAETALTTWQYYVNSTAALRKKLSYDGNQYRQYWLESQRNYSSDEASINTSGNAAGFSKTNTGYYAPCFCV